MKSFTAGTIVLVLISSVFADDIDSQRHSRILEMNSDTQLVCKIIVVGSIICILNTLAACISYRNATADFDAEYSKYQNTSAGYQPQVYHPSDGQQPNMNTANMNAPMLAKGPTDYPPGVNVL